MHACIQTVYIYLVLSAVTHAAPAAVAAALAAVAAAATTVAAVAAIMGAQGPMHVAACTTSHLLLTWDLPTSWTVMLCSSPLCAHREREGDLQGMVQDLRAGKYSALVLDAPVLEYISGTNEHCDLFLVGDVFESFSLALAFPPAAADAMVFDFSKAIVSLQVGGWTVVKLACASAGTW